MMPSTFLLFVLLPTHSFAVSLLAARSLLSLSVCMYILDGPKNFPSHDSYLWVRLVLSKLSHSLPSSFVRPLCFSLTHSPAQRLCHFYIILDNRQVNANIWGDEIKLNNKNILWTHNLYLCDNVLRFAEERSKSKCCFIRPNISTKHMATAKISLYMDIWKHVTLTLSLAPAFSRAVHYFESCRIFHFYSLVPFLPFLRSHRHLMKIKGAPIKRIHRRISTHRHLIHEHITIKWKRSTTSTHTHAYTFSLSILFHCSLLFNARRLPFEVALLRRCCCCCYCCCCRCCYHRLCHCCCCRCQFTISTCSISKCHSEQATYFVMLNFFFVRYYVCTLDSMPVLLIPTTAAVIVDVVVAAAAARSCRCSLRAFALHHCKLVNVWIAEPGENKIWNEEICIVNCRFFPSVLFYFYWRCLVYSILLTYVLCLFHFFSFVSW